jgi:hypothetical protein
MTGSAIRRFTWTLTAIGLSVATNPAFTQPVQERAPTTSSKPETAASADEAYRKGEEFEAKKNHAESMRWYRMAADRGHVKAEVSVGNLYGFSEGVSQDDAEALRWYRKAADEGNSEAQDDVGTFYLLGWGVSKNYREALRWLRKAADQGNEVAQRNVATIYWQGLGVPADRAEAIRWFRKAAEKGDDESKQALSQLGAQ